MITITLSASDAAVHLAENPLVRGFLGDQELLITVVLVAVLGGVFLKLALGISGFETGVSVMPLVRGKADDDPEHPEGRIRNTKRLLTSAALIMSFYLITSSFVTIVLIPSNEFKPGGAANGRALAYLAHEHLGSIFGTVYDLSTIAILAFAGASAMAGLLKLYLRDETGKTPNCYFGWTEGNPFLYVIRYILFGEEDTAPVAHEVLREAEPNPHRRPVIHVGGR